ncbi:hypothetical protein ACOZ3J_04290 [Weissella koreensis]|uniref:Multidrug effflux MFS transporter n=2 Tax=Weissella koreensis TaxID=165096 RepID=A0A7H1MM18_9LACO|nr:hypothetical protein [Weissella koreensis]QGN20526.1 hypothetical protein GKC51_04375 [Weissella koreensis]QNT64504.1 multidrug effflux MFS transporter [Weissella koreensis]
MNIYNKVIRNKINNSNVFNEIVIILLVVLLFGIPMMQNSMTWRTDAYFHLSRIFDINNYIKNFNIPLIVNLNTFSETGQAVNGMYPFYSLTPFILLTTWLNPMKQYFAINIIYIALGSILNYFVFQKMGSNKAQSFSAVILILSFINIFSFSSFSLQGVWSIYFMFPMAILSIIKINNDNLWYILLLSASISFMFNMHFISAFISVLVIGMFFIYVFYNSKNKINLLRNAVISAILFMILSLTTIINLISISKDKLQGLENFQLSSGTLNLEQMIHSLTNPSIFGVSIPSIFGSLLIIDIFLILCWKNLNHDSQSVVIIGLFFQLIISPYFPWDLLQKTPVSIIQFPTRLVPLILMLLVLVIVTDKFFNNMKILKGIIVLSLMLTLSFQTSNIVDKAKFNYFPSNDILFDHYEKNLFNYRENTKLTEYDLLNPIFYRLKTYPEYIPKITNNKTLNDKYSNSVNNHIVYANDKKINNVKVTVNNNVIIYKFKNDISGKIDIPLWSYKGVDYLDISRSKYGNIHTSKRNTIQVYSHKTNTIKIRVSNTKLVNISYLITTISWAILLISIFIKGIYQKKVNKF